MPAPESVSRLTKQFREHLDAYKSGKYNETQLRREFLDPFFVELGWDVFNTQGYAGDYKDVVHEAAIKIGGTTKAPDYSFRIGGQRKFFVEAKKPSVDVKGDPHPAYQLRRYAWTAGLPVSILSDFEEFAVYDCRVKPTPRDKAYTARILYMTFEEYEDRWEEIEGIFSKTAILKGAFDKYASKQTRKRGTAEPDEEFLKLLEGWRADLAQNIARNNTLTVRQINHAVQLIIDRIVFLRICEDRGVEVAGTLQALLNGSKVYERLFERFRHADAKYNSGLFHFHKEAGREAPDTLTPSLDVGDKILKDIIRNLYSPESPYELSVLPADILGHIYERFLGSVITLSKTGKTAKVEEKPEVRKAGGVYYTPTYIVNYIVQHTVGELLKDRSVEIREIGQGRGKPKLRVPSMDKPLRVLDPACGSGSFLLGAYDHLLEWHLRYYTDNDPESWAKLASPPIARKAIPDEKATHSDYKLTTHEKKRILTEHIYGVDIDAQAVEVTKLSLLLKVLEGENEETLQPLLFAKERALPDLSDNIRCGNSLIGSDFYSGQQGTMFDEEEQYRINAFDWDVAFKEIMESGGFDAVIGNPPYFNMDDTWGRDDARASYIKRAFPRVYRDKTDILFYFLAQGASLQRVTSMFIVSRAFLEAYKADKLRCFLASQTDVKRVIDFRNFYVFRGVGITTAIVRLVQEGRSETAEFCRLEVMPEGISEPFDLNDRKNFSVVAVPQSRLGSDPWVFGEDDTQALLDKLDADSDLLGDVLLIGQGMQTGRNKVFGKLNGQTMKSWDVPSNLYFSRARNSDIQRYHMIDRGEKLLYLEDVTAFENLPIAVQDHLRSHQRELEKRAAFKRGDCLWWRYTWPLHATHYGKNKLYCPYLARRNRFAPDFDRQFLGLTDTTVLFESGQPENLLYLLGLLNSSLLTFRFKYIGKLKSGGILEYFWNSVSRLPIRRIDFADQSDVPKHDRMVELVQTMLDMNERLHGEAGDKLTPQERRVLESRIASTDREIDRLVYDLYGLTDEEVAIVEQATQV